MVIIRYSIGLDTVPCIGFEKLVFVIVRTFLKCRCKFLGCKQLPEDEA